MLKKRNFLGFLLITIGLLPLFIAATLFIPGMQKYLVEKQLNSWISNASVDSIHISPFSIKIDNLRFKYEAIDIHISHLDSEISPFSLFSQRIKIDKFILDHIQINDSSKPTENKDDSTFLFHGLFPYFDTGFIYDIGLLNIDAEYTSSATGPVQASLSAHSVNENNNNPLVLKITAEELPDIPDVQGLSLDASIALKQHADTPINAHHSLFNLTLFTPDKTEQFISTELTMKQLPKPDKWASFPFDKRRTHYLQEPLHPESIELQITHTNQNNKVLAEIDFNGQYDGNEGIISGAIRLLTDKEFTRLFKSRALPKVESSLMAVIKYNTRSLEGNINLDDEFKIADYISAPLSDTESKDINTKTSSLPEQIDISNHLTASIDHNRLIINSFLLNMLSDGQQYIKILTHKPLSINLNNLPEFLEQQNSDLLTINISQLPLHWFDDFVPDYYIKNGFLDTDINLAIENKTLKLASNRPASLKNITILEKTDQPLMINQQADLQIEQLKANNKQAAQELLINQNLEADFIININNENLDASIKQLKLYQNINNEVINQISTSLTLNLKEPSHFLTKANESALPPLTINTKGNIDIRALTKIPVIARTLNQSTYVHPDTINPAATNQATINQDKRNSASVPTLSKSLPKALSLNYELAISGKASIWSINKSKIILSAGNNPKKISRIFTLNNSQNIQFKQHQEQLELITNGQLLSAQINQFNFNWLAPVITKYAAPYKLSGQLAQLDLSLSSKERTKTKIPEAGTVKTETSKNKESKVTERNFQLDIKQLKLSHLKSYNNQQLLFNNININTQIHANYSPDKLTISYPVLVIKKDNAVLINNSGKVIIRNPGNSKKQDISITGKLNGYLNHIMNLSIVNHYTKDKAALTQQSLLDAQYSLKIQDKKLIINRSELTILHPKSNGQLVLKTHQPISLSLQASLQNRQHNFSQNGHLSFELINFDVQPYESILTELPLTFDHANGHFDLIQTGNKQSIVLNKPFELKNIRFKDKEKRLLEPFNITLDFAANQYKNIAQGEIKQLAISFIDEKNNLNSKKENAFELNTKFKLDLNKEIILSELDGSLDLIITQWLRQPMAIPDNTLSQGTLNSQFSIDKEKHITHQWHISNLVAQNGEQLVESISINGTGQLKNLSSFNLDLPIIMKSISGKSNLLLKTQTTLNDKNKKIVMSIDGKEVFLNDFLKLLATINPQSEISKLEESPEPERKTLTETEQIKTRALNKTPASEPFWKSGFDIAAQLKIDKLYYSDYMSYHDIAGQLSMSDEKLHAKDFKIKFHESPMLLDALFVFNDDHKRPYNIKFHTSLSQFGVGKFLQELNPKHVPRADGVFDVDINIYGGLSNLTQFRNELLFDMLIEGKDGVYHLIPADDAMMRSSGAVMATVGEVVSVLPTSGFGLGIVNRVIRFAKDIDYDFIKMHLVRQKDLNTTIEEFKIISPELYLFATGGLTFKEDTRLFDQPLEMTAQIDLAGEGAAIFYGLGLLNQEQDEYGFWKGPVINFSGTLNHQKDNFNEIISKAKSGTVLGGVTNPFSGIIGNFKYRWFGDSPDYSQLNKKTTDAEKTIPTSGQPVQEPAKQKEIKQKSVQPASQNPSFFDETFQ